MSNPMYTADAPTLSCWKDIARYLGKGVRTVQRWEREFGLPVRRPNGALLDARKAPVAADPDDLQAWLRLRWGMRPARQARDGSRQNRDRITPQQLRFDLQRSRELQAVMKNARQAHHDAVRDITATVISLTQNCQYFSKKSELAADVKQTNRGLERQTSGVCPPSAVNLAVQASSDPNTAGFSPAMP